MAITELTTNDARIRISAESNSTHASKLSPTTEGNNCK